MNGTNPHHKQKDDDNAGENFSDGQENVLRETLDIENSLVEIRRVSGQKESVGTSSIGAEHPPSQPVGKTEGVPDSHNLAQKTPQTSEKKHEDGKATRNHQQPVVVHGGKQM